MEKHKIFLKLKDFLPNTILKRILWNEKINKKSWKFDEIHYIKTMEAYCVSCKKYTANKNSSVKKTKQNWLMLLLSCAVCGKKKTSFY